MENEGRIDCTGAFLLRLRLIGKKKEESFGQNHHAPPQR